VLLDVAETHSRHGVTEACIRVLDENGSSGGVWVVGRRLRLRFIFFVVENCVSYSEMCDQVSAGTNGVLGQVMV
jgi:hypothetical protein